MSALLDLAERCEAATGPDRELDAEIAKATGWQSVQRESYGQLRGRLNDTRRVIPPFSRSLDAAMPLVPDETTGDLLYQALGRLPRNWPPTVKQDLPRFLCAAALRARAAEQSALNREGGSNG